jgi:hypothetical protein
MVIRDIRVRGKTGGSEFSSELSMEILGCSEPWFYGYLGVLNFDFAVLWLVRHLGVRIPEFTVPLDLRILSVLRTLLGCLLRVIWFFGYFLGRMARW